MKQLLIYIIVALIVAACGVKAPPVPKNYVPPQAVKDLRYTIDNGAVALAWTAPGTSDPGAYRISGAKVFRLRTPLGDTLCENCPLVFNKIKDIPVNKPAMTYRETLDKGFQFRYKIVLYDENDIDSGDSNVVSFEYP